MANATRLTGLSRHPARESEWAAGERTWPLDLCAEAATLRAAGTDYEVHTGEGWYEDEEPDADGRRFRGNVDLTVLWVPSVSRAGVCANGSAQWTDAVSPEDAAERFLTDRMAE